MKNLVLLYWFYQFNFQTKLFIPREFLIFDLIAKLPAF